MTKLLVVTRCNDCPCEYDGSCAHEDAPRGGIDTDAYDGVIPPLCPLRTEPLHIHLAPQLAVGATRES